ncbi:E3 ubiquitin protein ligase AIRP2-like protein [Tanacetum coccineum]|uniref:E3 ubiquitin protein ligase AIRP2-like protein n=1 Tax=Tanacetum coccineum TaxID=301880 RepID=A0ABQ4XN86_9ASTR
MLVSMLSLSDLIFFGGGDTDGGSDDEGSAASNSIMHASADGDRGVQQKGRPELGAPPPPRPPHPSKHRHHCLLHRQDSQQDPPRGPPHPPSDQSQQCSITHVGGDMYDCVPQGDMMFMKWLLGNVGDQGSKTLKNYYNALPDDRKVILIEAILPFLSETSSVTKVPQRTTEGGLLICKAVVVSNTTHTAAAIPKTKDGARFQMKLVHDQLIPFIMFLLPWIDSSCTCLLPRYLNLFHVIVYKVYTDGRPNISRHERKATVNDFYG